MQAVNDAFEVRECPGARLLVEGIIATKTQEDDARVEASDLLHAVQPVRGCLTAATEVLNGDPQLAAKDSGIVAAFGRAEPGSQAVPKGDPWPLGRGRKV